MPSSSHLLLNWNVILLHWELVPFENITPYGKNAEKNMEYMDLSHRKSMLSVTPYLGDMKETFSFLSSTLDQNGVRGTRHIAG